MNVNTTSNVSSNNSSPVSTPRPILSPATQSKVENRANKASAEAEQAKNSGKSAARSGLAAASAAANSVGNAGKASGNLLVNAFSYVTGAARTATHRVSVESPRELTTVRKPLHTAAGLGVAAGVAGIWAPAATLAIGGVTLPFILAAAALVSAGTAVVSVITRAFTSTAPAIAGLPEYDVDHEVASTHNRIKRLETSKAKEAKNVTKAEKELEKAQDKLNNAKAAQAKHAEGVDSKIAEQQEALVKFAEANKAKAQEQVQAAEEISRETQAVNDDAEARKGAVQPDITVIAKVNAPTAEAAAAAKAELENSAAQIEKDVA